MDFASSFAGLVTLATAVIGAGGKLIGMMKSAPKEINSLINEVTNVYAMVNSLSIVMQKSDTGPLAPSSSQGSQLIKDCEQLLQEAHEMLVKFDTSGSAFKSRTKWPFKVSDVERLMNRIQRNMSHLSIALHAYGMDTHRCDIEARSRKEVASGTRKYFEGHSPAGKYAETLRHRHPGTLQWFLRSEEFVKWSDEETSSLWLHGIPGAGKTIIMSTIIEHLLNTYSDDPTVGVAYWFCQNESPITYNPSSVLGSVLIQLAAQNVSRSFKAAAVIIDGLDECPQPLRWTLLELLSDINQPSGSIKTIYASRKELDIQRAFAEFPTVEFSASPADIKLFVYAETEKRVRSKALNLSDPGLQTKIIETLVDKAGGMFQWVICQLDYVCLQFGDKRKLEALETLPPDLFSTYEQILGVAYQHKSVREMIRRVIIWVTWTRSLWTLPQLAQAIALDQMVDRYEANLIPTGDDILKWCSSLLRIDGYGRVDFSHFTVREFFAFRRKGTVVLKFFSPASEEAPGVIASSCLKSFYLERALGNSDEGGDPAVEDFVKKNAFDYAVQYGYEDQTHEALWKIFGVKGTKLDDIEDIQKRCNEPRQVRIRNCIKGFDNGFGLATPLQWAALFGFQHLCNTLLDAGADTRGKLDGYSYSNYRVQNPARPLVCTYIPVAAAIQVVCSDAFQKSLDYYKFNHQLGPQPSRYLDIIEDLLDRDAKAARIKKHKSASGATHLPDLDCKYCRDLECEQSLLNFYLESLASQLALRSTDLSSSWTAKRLPGSEAKDIYTKLLLMLLRGGARINNQIVQVLRNYRGSGGGSIIVLILRAPKEYFDLADDPDSCNYLIDFAKDAPPKGLLKRLGIEIPEFSTLAGAKDSGHSSAY